MSDGLENVIAAETALSDVDGLAGKLIIRGLPLDAIAGRLSYEEALALLWNGFFPALPRDLQRPLGKARAEVFADAQPHIAAVADLPVFDAMRVLMARLPDGADLPSALRIAAAPGTLLAPLLRQRAGGKLLPPDPD